MCLQTSLQSCLKRRVGLLLARQLVRFVAVDSVASLFRSEFGLSDWLEKTKQLLTLSSTLHHLCHQFNSAVLCINQVSPPHTHTHTHGRTFFALTKNRACVVGDGHLQRLRRIHGVKSHLVAS